jgi:hypothetical protein
VAFFFGRVLTCFAIRRDPAPRTHLGGDVFSFTACFSTAWQFLAAVSNSSNGLSFRKSFKSGSSSNAE